MPLLGSRKVRFIITLLLDTASSQQGVRTYDTFLLQSLDVSWRVRHCHLDHLAFVLGFITDKTRPSTRPLSTLDRLAHRCSDLQPTNHCFLIDCAAALDLMPTLAPFIRGTDRPLILRCYSISVRPSTTTRALPSQIPEHHQLTASFLHTFNTAHLFRPSITTIQSPLAPDLWASYKGSESAAGWTIFTRSVTNGGHLSTVSINS